MSWGSQQETLKVVIPLHDLSGEAKNSVLLVSLDDLNHFLNGDIMINRDSQGHLYSNNRGEILGQFEDKLLQKHLSRMFSLIKNES